MQTTAARFLTRAELAQMLKVHQQTITEWTRKGKLPQPYRIGHKLLYDVAEVNEQLAKERNPSTCQATA